MTRESCFDWRGVLKPAWREAMVWYVAELQRRGLLPAREGVRFPGSGKESPVP